MYKYIIPHWFYFLQEKRDIFSISLNFFYYSGNSTFVLANTKPVWSTMYT
jgi:hypothetical protein